MKSFRPSALYVLLLLDIAISLTYQIVASAPLIVGYFNLRHQVQEPFRIALEQPVVTSVTEPAQRAGLAAGDVIESLNGVPYKGRALWQSIRWRAHLGDLVRVGVRRSNGTRAVLSIPFVAYRRGALANEALNNIRVGEASFLIFLQIVVPLFCLVLGYWVALARPADARSRGTGVWSRHRSRYPLQRMVRRIVPPKSPAH